MYKRQVYIPFKHVRRRVVPHAVERGKESLRRGNIGIARFQKIDKSGRGVDLACIPCGHIEKDAVLLALVDAVKLVCELIGAQEAAVRIGRGIFRCV